MTEIIETKEISPSSITGSNDVCELDWDDLFEVCKEKDMQLNLAGECGMKLHEELVESKNMIEELRSKHDAAIEKLVQENYQLSTKITQQDRTVISQQQENEAIQNQLTKKFQCELDEVQNRYNKEISASKKVANSLRSELEQVKLSECQAQTRIKQLDERLAEVQRNNQSEERELKTSEESELIKKKLLFLEDLLEEKEKTIRESKNKEDSLELDRSRKQQDISSLRTELENSEAQSTLYFNHLQQVRQEAAEVQAELDSLRAELKSSGHCNSGNSLFAEVEDKRVEAEKNYLSIKMKHQSLLNAYEIIKSRYYTTKCQVLSLLSMGSGKLDEDRVCQLDRALSQAQSEVVTLTNQLRSALQVQTMHNEDIKKVAEALPGFSDNADYIDFLSVKIKNLQNEQDKLRKDLDHLHMIKIAETDKLHKTERQLYVTEQFVTKYKNENAKFRLRLEDAQKKLTVEIKKREHSDFKEDDNAAREKAANKTLPPTLAKTLPAKVRHDNRRKVKRHSNNVEWDMDRAMQRLVEKSKHEYSSRHLQSQTSGKKMRVSFKDQPEKIPCIEQNGPVNVENEDKENQISS